MRHAHQPAHVELLGEQPARLDALPVSQASSAVNIPAAAGRWRGSSAPTPPKPQTMPMASTATTTSVGQHRQDQRDARGSRACTARCTGHTRPMMNSARRSARNTAGRPARPRPPARQRTAPPGYELRDPPPCHPTSSGSRSLRRGAPPIAASPGVQPAGRQPSSRTRIRRDQHGGARYRPGSPPQARSRRSRVVARNSPSAQRDRRHSASHWPWSRGTGDQFRDTGHTVLSTAASAASSATSVPPPMATPASAAARGGRALMPSPPSPRRRAARSRAILAQLSSGSMLRPRLQPQRGGDRLGAAPVVAGQHHRHEAQPADGREAGGGHPAAARRGSAMSRPGRHRPALRRRCAPPPPAAPPPPPARRASRRPSLA